MTQAEASDSDWEQLVETSELYEAKLIELRLREADIDARLLDQIFHQEPMPSVRALSLVRVLVHRDQLDAARELLAVPADLPEDVDPGAGED